MARCRQTLEFMRLNGIETTSNPASKWLRLQREAGGLTEFTRTTWKLRT
jgi:hypothetical protein